ncbi:MAG: glycosyltransferase family 4 protein [Methanospirillaceae archaeon]|nr:glycosyltransferase family 4 protein [Methanospirillaceae archaeon]
MKIIFVANPASIHAIRWIQQISGYDIIIYSSNNCYCNPDFKYPVYSPLPGQNKFLCFINRLIFKLILYIQKKFTWISVVFDIYFYILVFYLKPDIIHTLGINNNWNICLHPEIKVIKSRKNRKKPIWIVSSWGTDLDLFPNLGRQNYNLVKSIFLKTDFYISECHRDFSLAKKFGFQGEFLGFLPAFGGIDIENMNQYSTIPPKNRNGIFLKGRDISDGDIVGRGLNAIKALNSIQEHLLNLDIFIAQSGPNIHNEVSRQKEKLGINYEELGYLRYEEILQKIGLSKIFISLTVNDGLPGSLIEAMILGALPIHSNLDPIREWIEHGINGLLVNPENIDDVRGAILFAINNPSFIEKAAHINKKIIEDRLSYYTIRKRVIEIYEQVIHNY